MDDKKSDADRERAAMLLLAEDSLVKGVQLATASRLSTDALPALLELAQACELDIARASPVNDRDSHPLLEYVNYGGEEEQKVAVASLVKSYLPAGAAAADAHMQNGSTMQNGWNKI